MPHRRRTIVLNKFVKNFKVKEGKTILHREMLQKEKKIEYVL